MQPTSSRRQDFDPKPVDDQPGESEGVFVRPQDVVARAPVHPHLVRSTLGTVHVWGRVRLREGQARPRRVEEVAFEWIGQGDHWAFHAHRSRSFAGQVERVAEVVDRVAGSSASVIDLALWEPPQELEEGVLANGAVLVYRDGRPVEVRYEANLDDDPVASTKWALMEALGTSGAGLGQQR